MPRTRCVGLHANNHQQNPLPPISARMSISSWRLPTFLHSWKRVQRHGQVPHVVMGTLRICLVLPALRLARAGFCSFLAWRYPRFSRRGTHLGLQRQKLRALSVCKDLNLVRRARDCTVKWAVQGGRVVDTMRNALWLAPLRLVARTTYLLLLCA